MSGTLDNERFRKLLLSSPATAIEILYQQHFGSLKEMSLYLTKNAEVSQDVVEEAFIHVWENRHKLSQYHERSILHYLAKMVKYKSISEYRRAGKTAERKTRYRDDHHADLLVRSVEATIIQNEIRQEVREIIATFPTKERECLFMKLDEELSVDQIAERLKVTRKAVERSLTSANKRLRLYWQTRL